MRLFNCFLLLYVCNCLLLSFCTRVHCCYNNNNSNSNNNLRQMHRLLLLMTRHCTPIGWATTFWGAQTVIIVQGVTSFPRPLNIGSYVQTSLYIQKGTTQLLQLIPGIYVICAESHAQISSDFTSRRQCQTILTTNYYMISILFTDHKITAQCPDLVLVDKQLKFTKLIDINQLRDGPQQHIVTKVY